MIYNITLTPPSVPDGASRPLDPPPLLVDGRVVFCAERQSQRPPPSARCRRLHPTEHRLETQTLLEVTDRLPRGTVGDKDFTLLSPRLATYTVSSTARTQVAVEPSFHAGFLLREREELRHPGRGAMLQPAAPRPPPNAYWLDAVLRKSSSVCRNVSRRHLLISTSMFPVSPEGDAALFSSYRSSQTST